MVRLAQHERPRPDWLRRHPQAWLAAVGTVCFGAFMGQLDASVVALTYHAVGREFDAPLGVVQWISLSYLLTLGALLVPLGRLSDRIGRKRVYLWGFAAFTVASAACALAPNLPALAALRAVQGGGAAMLQANSVAIVATSAPRRRLRAALGMQAAAQAVGLAVGPTVGGLVVQTLGWRWVFGVNVPVGVVAMVAGSWLLPRSRLPDTAPPRLPAVLRAPGFVRGLAGALLGYLLLFGPIVLVPTVLQDRGRSALFAGLVAGALPLGFAAGSLAGERVLPHGWSSAVRGRVGLLLAAAGLAALLGAPPGGAGWPAALAAIGVGLGVFTPANNAVVMTCAPAGAAAVAGGMVSASRAAGTAAATALVAGAVVVGPHGAGAAGALLGLAALAVLISWRSGYS